MSMEENREAREARGTKAASASHTTQSHIVMYSDANGTGRLFGGRLMSWMDVTGAVAARRHAGREVLTASVDRMSFLTPASANDTVVIEADVRRVGRTSMQVEVTAWVERLSEARAMLCTSTFVYVALDEFGRPTQVPHLGGADWVGA